MQWIGQENVLVYRAWSEKAVRRLLGAVQKCSVKKIRGEKDIDLLEMPMIELTIGNHEEKCR